MNVEIIPVFYKIGKKFTTMMIKYLFMMLIF